MRVVFTFLIVFLSLSIDALLNNDGIDYNIAPFLSDQKHERQYRPPVPLRATDIVSDQDDLKQFLEEEDFEELFRPFHPFGHSGPWGLRWW